MLDERQDIAQFPWYGLLGDQWTTREIRRVVIVWAIEYVASRSWLKAWDVIERFTDRGVSVAVPRQSPVQPAELEDFRKRPGLPVLLIGVTRRRDGRRFEVGLSFPGGAQTSLDEVGFELQRARASLDAEHRRLL